MQSTRNGGQAEARVHRRKLPGVARPQTGFQKQHSASRALTVVSRSLTIGVLDLSL